MVHSDFYDHFPFPTFEGYGNLLQHLDFGEPLFTSEQPGSGFSPNPYHQLRPYPNHRLSCIMRKT